MSDYKSMMDKITVPEDLMKKTRDAMAAEAKEMATEDAERDVKPTAEKSTAAQPGSSVASLPPANKRRKKRLLMTILPAAAAVLLVLIVGNFMLFGNSNYIRTDLPDGAFVAQVTTEDGQLQFDTDTSGLDSSPHLGGDVTDSSAQTEVIFEEEGAAVTQTTYSNQDALSKSANSTLGGTPLYASYDATNDIFRAEFTRDGSLYILTSENVSEEQFITVLEKALG